MTSPDPDYVRYTIALIFDVPKDRAGIPATVDALNGATSRIVELVEQDARLQWLLRRAKLEWGLSDGSWEVRPE